MSGHTRLSSRIGWAEPGRDKNVLGDLRWLLDVLWGGSDLVRATVNEPLQSGFREIGRYAIIPGAARPRFLVPLGSPRAAWSSLRLYNTLRPPRTQWARALVAAAFRLGVGPALARHRVRVGVAENVAGTNLGRLLIEDHVKEVLGLEDVTMAIGVGRPGPNRKPVLQAIGADGSAAGYVKVGWNDFTRRLVRNEGRALRRLAAAPVAALHVPRLLHQGEWRGLELTIVSPLASDVRRYAPARRPPPLEVSRQIAALSGPGEKTLEETSWARGVLARLDAGSSAGVVDRGTVGRVRDFLRRHAQARLLFGAWHGDWVPWNLARLRGELVAWDWEHAADEVPVGFDPLHFHFHLAFVIDRMAPPEAVVRATAGSASALRALGVPDNYLELVSSLYVLEILARHIAAAAQGAGRNPRLLPSILEVATARMEEA